MKDEYSAKERKTQVDYAKSDKRGVFILGIFERRLKPSLKSE
jgi:hypothetical protein